MFVTYSVFFIISFSFLFFFFLSLLSMFYLLFFTWSIEREGERTWRRTRRTNRTRRSRRRVEDEDEEEEARVRSETTEERGVSYRRMRGEAVRDEAAEDKDEGQKV